MLACVDVDYRVRGAVAGCVLFDHWSDELAARELVAHATEVEPYVSGQLYRRELPMIEKVLALVEGGLDVIVVDGNVWLDAAGTPGLGARLWEARGRASAVVGVAKSAYAGAPAIEVRRGASANPLYVTAAGMDPTVAAAHIAGMHGPYRVPALLTRVDRLCRTAPLPAAIGI
jgi:deoxyribonuclease V